MSSKYGFLLIVLFFLVSCKKREDQYPFTKIGGHACAGLHISSSNYHDNSLEAYRYALSFEKVEMIEIDVQLSLDGTLWLFHDAELDTESDGSGKIPQKHDDYLSGLRYKSLEKERMIRLTDLPSNLNGISLILDLKESDGAGGIVDSTLLYEALIGAQEYFYNGNLAIISNTGRFFDVLHELTSYLTYYNATNVEAFLNSPNSGNSYGVVFRNADISATDVDVIKSLGNRKVIIYDVRSPDGIESALDKRPHYLLTDDIKATLIEKYK
nr:glycerophosphodiester phosphodiesterase family protein [uncultured Fluviicola sp.]